MVVGTCAAEGFVWRRKGDSLSLFGKALSKGWKPVYQHSRILVRLCGGGASSSCEVGMDIEAVNGTRVRKVASRFIRSDEESTMMEGDEVYALLLHWSAKEALFKLMGVEEVDFIRHLRIFPFSLSEEGEFEACEYRTGRQGRYRVRYVTHPDFVLTWIIK